MRKAGILMPVFSLPSRAGVGDFGKEAYRFIHLLKENGVRIWQILPINPAGFGNSPYQPFSSFAGDDIYISLDLLYEEGLIEELPPAFREKAKKVDYASVRSFKEPYLWQAYKNFLQRGGKEDSTYQQFISKGWVRDYALFCALKKENDGFCWNDWDEWKEADKTWTARSFALSQRAKREEDFQSFKQFLFFSQWMKLKKEANSLGIEIMGDLPFYVGTDSADVFFDREDFLLDKEGHPLFVSGVPPDYFSKSGQLWGNPIYDWDHMKKTGYRFWTDRIRFCKQVFDIVRIDHFRAFDTYWKIPAASSTAEKGEWERAPGYEVLDRIFQEITDLELVAEDLGETGSSVSNLRDHYHLKGMKVFIFSLDSSGKRACDTYRDVRNLIIYTGTHDNDTFMEWYGKLSIPSKRKVRRFLKRHRCCQGSVKDRALIYILRSKADYAIIPMADVLGLGKEGHINTPGTVGSPNWEWRMTGFEKAEANLRKYRRYFKDR